jgi:hypothetical protein
MQKALVAIAFEDVGVGSVDTLIQTTTACTGSDWRAGIGGDEVSLRIVVRLLAEAPKDRSPDHLICAAHDAIEVKNSLKAWFDLSSDGSFNPS